jgi:signal transduction histidine kinase
VKSLRSRLMLGALLWTVGLVTLVNVVILHLVRQRFPGSVVHYHLMSLLAIGLLIAALATVRVGMAPLARLRTRVAALRDGREPRIEGEYPTEVEPLVKDLNALLAEREERVARARAKAADLAHGLKTPLAVLAQEAARARQAGQAELAATIEPQVERMRRQVEYHLAQARAAGAGADPAVRCAVAVSAEGLVRALQRLHAERGLAIRIDVAPEHVVRCQREDLDEMLGNLLDNACKWARSAVSLSCQAQGKDVDLTVDDDGPGLDPSLRDAVLRRGVRADETAPGSGLGLAIVRDLAELYGGSIVLDRSPAGGLRAELRLPAAGSG